MRLILLQQAVEAIPDPRRVRIVDGLMRTRQAATTSLTYSSYYELVKDAAFHHDGALVDCTSQQQVHVHNFDFGDPDSAQTDAADEDPDHSTADVGDGLSYSVYMTTVQSNHVATKVFLSKLLWDQLSLDDKKLII